MKINLKKGFTFIETLVAMAIIAALALISVPQIEGLVEQARLSSDQNTLRELNSATSIYRINHFPVDPFLDLDNSSEDLITLLNQSGYIKSHFKPKTDAEFIWDVNAELWTLGLSQNELIQSVLDVFASKMRLSGIEYDVFLSKNESFNVGSPPYSEYNVNSWNGYLEKILEAGHVASNLRITSDNPNYGSNTIGYENPFSENENRGTIVNLLNLGVINLFRTNPVYKTMSPPAIILTNHANFDHNRVDDSYIRSNSDVLKGSIIFYKANNRPNSDVQIYYIKEDGSKSELVHIQEILGN